MKRIVQKYIELAVSTGVEAKAIVKACREEAEEEQVLAYIDHVEKHNEQLQNFIED